MKDAGTYNHVIRSATGRTPADPCPVQCTRQDAKDWTASAETIGAAVQWQYERLESYAIERNQIVPASIDTEAGNFFAQLDALQVPTERSLPDAFRRSIDQSIETMRGGAATLEAIERQMLKMGMTPPTIPGFPRAAPRNNWQVLPTVAALTMVSVLGVGVYMAVRTPSATTIEE